MASGTTADLYGVWGSSASDVFAVGAGRDHPPLRRHDLEADDLGHHGRPHAVWGSSASDVFAVGQVGTILHYDGTSWKPMTSGTTAAPQRRVGELGERRLRRRANRAPSSTTTARAGSRMSLGHHRALTGVWGSSASDVFAVGCRGTILHYDGTSWRPLDSGTW